MEKFIIENLGLLIAVFFLIGLVLIQRWKIKYLERLVVNSDDLKSRAEFETKESQAGAYFQEKVIGELLKEFSDEELMAIEDRMARHIRRMSNMEIQDGDMLLLRTENAGRMLKLLQYEQRGIYCRCACTMRYCRFCSGG